jgi:hypothetical protein
MTNSPAISQSDIVGLTKGPGLSGDESDIRTILSAGHPVPDSAWEKAATSTRHFKKLMGLVREFCPEAKPPVDLMFLTWWRSGSNGRLLEWLAARAVLDGDMNASTRWFLEACSLNACRKDPTRVPQGLYRHKETFAVVGVKAEGSGDWAPLMAALKAGLSADLVRHLCKDSVIPSVHLQTLFDHFQKPGCITLAHLEWLEDKGFDWKGELVLHPEKTLVLFEALRQGSRQGLVRAAPPQCWRRSNSGQTLAGRLVRQGRMEDLSLMLAAGLPVGPTEDLVAIALKNVLQPVFLHQILHVLLSHGLATHPRNLPLLDKVVTQTPLASPLRILAERLKLEMVLDIREPAVRTGRRL